MPFQPPNETQLSPDFLLVLPAFRELHRLPSYLASLVEALASAPFTTEVLVVDDGSPVGEQEALRAAVRVQRTGNCAVIDPLMLPTNALKGGAILAGWLSRHATWLAFADADGATSAAEVRRVLGAINALDPARQQAFFAVRETSGPAPVRRTAVRRILSTLFSRLAGFALHTEPMDFQCGFKVIPGKFLPEAADSLQGRGLCFDLALFLALRSAGIQVQSIPISWTEQPGGRVSPWRDGPGLIAGLWSLSRNGLERGRANKNPA
jgi:glycosyltransferase involved in cell wall biosynthesis